MRVLVLGAGAVGLVLGCRLQTGGHDVLLVGRPAHVAAIREHGVRVEGVGAGTFRLPAAESVPAGPAIDLAVVTTKTFDLDEALFGYARARPPSPTLLVQNGLGIEATAVSALRRGGWSRPERWVVRAVQSIPATLTGPGTVRATGTGEVVLPDVASAGESAEAAAMFLKALAPCGFELRTSSNLAREIWKKLLVNAAINPVTAIHGVVNGELVSGPLHAEAVRLLEEARRVAERSGVPFSSREAVGEFERVARSTAANRSSMLQDVERGRPTEVDAILGEVLRQGERLGLELPATRSALEAVRARATAKPRTPQPL